MGFLILGLVLLIASFCFKGIHRGWILLPVWVIYLLFEFSLGLLAKYFIQEKANYQFEFSNTYIVVLIISILCLFGGAYLYKILLPNYSFGSQKKLESNKIVALEGALQKVVIFLFIIFFPVSIKMIFSYLSSSSIDNRNSIISSLSGFEFLTYKIGLVIVCLLGFYRHRKKNFLYDLLLVYILVSYYAYGARFLLFSAIILFVLIFYFNKLKVLKGWQVFILVLMYLILSVFFANTRYYMSNGDSFEQSITYEKFMSTAFMQTGGNWLDFSRVENSNAKIDLSKNFFPTILEGFLPESIRSAFFKDFFSERLSYGKYFAGKINEDENALRLNFNNEIFFSFGYFGVIFFSILLGFLFEYFQRFLSSSYYPISIFFMLQILSLHILGSNTFSNSLILCVVAQYSLSFIVRKRSKVSLKRKV